jgi:hypothetical protein
VSIKDELVLDEDARSEEFHALLHRLDREQVERVGYTDIWSVKDLLGHMGSWFAEAARVLEQIRMGTHARQKLDVEANNAHYYEIWKDAPLDVVRAEWWSAHNRMLEEWGRLDAPNRLAQEWFRESGPAHHDEHLPRMREWVQEVSP